MHRFFHEWLQAFLFIFCFQQFEYDISKCFLYCFGIYPSWYLSCLAFSELFGCIVSCIYYLGRILDHYSSNFPFSVFLLLYDYMALSPFDILSQVFDALFYCFPFFSSLCFSLGSLHWSIKHRPQEQQTHGGRALLASPTLSALGRKWSWGPSGRSSSSRTILGLWCSSAPGSRGSSSHPHRMMGTVLSRGL